MDLEGRYRELTPGSSALAQRASAVMPGGDTRSVTYHAPYPLTIATADGPWLRDVDGNRYVDLLVNYTSLVHGHAYPPIVDAVSRAVASGSAWAARNVPQLELAELLCERIGSVETVRFTNSGTEAGMLAATLARKATGRRRLLKARFGYHGSYPDLEAGLADVGPTDTLLAPFGDAVAFETLLDQHGAEIAAVFLEPVLGSGGVVSPPEDFLPRVQRAARRAGAVLVLDEVITFRLATGGAQGLSGVDPDLTMLGKLIGGGLPVGALGGRADLLSLLDPSRRSGLSHSGTFNGNPVTAAAGLVAVSELTPGRIAAMDESAARIETGIRESLRRHGLPGTTRRAGSLVQIALVEPSLQTALHLAALCHGVFMAARGLIATCTVLSDQVCDEALRRLDEAVAEVARLAKSEPAATASR